MNHHITLEGAHRPLDAAGLATFVDHTLLKPEATRADVNALVAEAVRLGVYAVCVSPSFLPLEVPVGLDGAPDVKVATVVGFPSGKHHSDVKAAEAARAVRDGADEVDMVIDIGAAKERRFEDVQADIAAVRAAVPHPTVLKVILETAALSDHEIIESCRAAAAAGADFVKTSTGFHPAGGATVRAVGIMAGTVGGRLGIKASGGIRTAADAIAMINAGATRLGLSSTAAVLGGLTADEGSY
ncbi:MAG: deoxyribose-phosphate aldolase [Cellulomonas sp. 14-74-6]|nr:MAG: deoxyribose-phosphate aldolase [Cellulomonas sp. 14-74-6]